VDGLDYCGDASDGAGGTPGTEALFRRASSSFVKSSTMKPLNVTGAWINFVGALDFVCLMDAGARN